MSLRHQTLLVGWLMYPRMGHFEIYINEGFMKASEEQLSFFQRTLLA